MTPESREALEDYVVALGQALELFAWEIIVRTDPVDEEDHAYASIGPTYGKKEAELRVCGDFVDLKPEKQRYVLTHELVHLHLASATDIVRCTTGKTLGQPAYDVLWEAFKQQVEYGVDAIARAIAPHMPLPVGLSDNDDTVSSSVTEGGAHGDVETEGGRTKEPQEGTRRSPRSKGKAA